MFLAIFSAGIVTQKLTSGTLMGAETSVSGDWILDIRYWGLVDQRNGLEREVDQPGGVSPGF